MKQPQRNKMFSAMKTLTFGLAVYVPPEISLLTGFSYICITIYSSF